MINKRVAEIREAVSDGCDCDSCVQKRDLLGEIDQLRELLANSTYDEDPPRRDHKRLSSDTYWARYGEIFESSDVMVPCPACKTALRARRLDYECPDCKQQVVLGDSMCPVTGKQHEPRGAANAPDPRQVAVELRDIARRIEAAPTHTMKDLVGDFRHAANVLDKLDTKWVELPWKRAALDHAENVRRSFEKYWNFEARHSKKPRMTLREVKCPRGFMKWLWRCPKDSTLKCYCDKCDCGGARVNWEGSR